MTSTAMPAPAILGQHRAALEAALRSAVGDDVNPLTAAVRYAMGWEDESGTTTDAGGKRIRPALCLFAAGAFGGSVQEALPGAVAVELVHNFSLVHDEVQDRDAERHHRPTVWARMGEAQAINVGDFLYTRAVRALTVGPGDGSRRLYALHVLNDAISRMIQGQWQDIAFEARTTVTVDEYLDMVAGKTGALLAAPLEIGAILAGAPDEAAAAVGRWGAHVGAAFQAQDDYLGIWGNPNRTGKSNTNDIVRRKKTLPIVHGSADPDVAAAIARTHGQQVVSERDVESVVAALKNAGSDEYCRARARSQAAEADTLLEEIPLTNTVREQFRAIAAYLVDRES